MCHRKRWVFLLVLLAASCGPGQRPGTPAGAGGTSARGGSDGWPTEEEARAYLDGKALPLKVQGGVPVPDGQSITIHRERIAALEVSQSGSQVNGEPWSTQVTFIYDDHGSKYAVEATVHHRKVADQRAFFGFDVTRVAKQ
jgi:hypothetical protein